MFGSNGSTAFALDAEKGDLLWRFESGGGVSSNPISFMNEGKQHVHNLIAKIRGENAVKQDGFLIAHIDRRRELRGLPFVMGAACRLPMERARSFQESVTSVRESMDTAVAINQRLHLGDGNIRL